MFDFGFISGLGDFIPFLFVLGVVYGSLEVSGVFKGNRAVNFIIAVAVSFFALSNPAVSSFINNIIPYATILFIVVFGIMFLKKTVFAGISGGTGDKEKQYSFLMIVLMFVFIFLNNVSSAYSMPFMGMVMNDETVAIAGIIIMLLIFYIAWEKKG